MISVGQAVGFGLNILGKLGKKKRKSASPQSYAALELSKSGFRESRTATPGKPDSGRVAKVKQSEELYDYYQMVAKAKLVADRLDPEKGTQVGEFGTFKV
tara:strand:+ start:202 stop:501 length:300 start_codon:yes stop_codon:yes gene_type:complete